MFSVSETARSAHIRVFSLSPFRKESWSASYSGVCYAGHKMCTLCTGTENSCVRVRSNACASPCNLQAGHLKKKMHRVSAQMYLRATVQDVYAVYKMRVISQNSRRKAIADTATN
jgi:hypothetical protein